MSKLAILLEIYFIAQKPLLHLKVC